MDRGRVTREREIRNMSKPAASYRILVIDDNAAIHDDFRKILAPAVQQDQELSDLEAALFGDSGQQKQASQYQLDFASQGEEGLLRVVHALEQGSPYALVFVDVRMPPGWDGIQTLEKIWQQDPYVQTVICTAYSDYSWSEVRHKLGHSDRLLVLKKPFDNIEVLQLADMLTYKWSLTQQRERHLTDLQQMINERTRELQLSQNKLDAVQRQLSGADLAAMTMDTQQRQRAVLADKLSKALDTGELSVNYQPLIEVASRRIAGLEALVRWQDPVLGAVSPAEFIPVAEETGLILPLGEFVLRSACRQIVSWERTGVPAVPVSINVSPVQLQRQNLLELVGRVLAETGMRPDRLVLELTESCLIANAQAQLAQLQALRDMGVGVEIDDFGTGYSCLSYLKHLPIDALKIDRSFISHVDSNARDESIVGAILSMSQTLGIKVVAEGVETAAQFETLRRHRCEYVQGYFFSRPLPASQCREMLLELASRTSFTDTLRLQMNSSRSSPRAATPRS